MKELTVGHGTFGIGEVKVMKPVIFQIIAIIIILLPGCGLEEEVIYDELPALSWPTVTIFKDNIFVHCGYHTEYGGVVDYGGIYSSKNGKDWTLIKDKPEFPPRVMDGIVEYNGKLWITGGELSDDPTPAYEYEDDVWSSSNGKDWTCVTEHAPFGKRAYHSLIVFNGAMWVIGGMVNKIAAATTACSSTDGETWQCYNSNLESGHPRCVVYDGRIYISSGSGLFVSDNAVTWETITLDTLVPHRTGHAFLVYNSKFWVMGGREAYGSVPQRLYDVWNTTMDVLENWSRVSMDSLYGMGCPYNSSFPAYNAIVYKDKIWNIVGGYYEWSVDDQEHYYVLYNRYTTDGINWLAP